MMILVAYFLCLLAFVALCQSLNRHFKQVWNCSPSSRSSRLLRGAGITLLLGSYMLAVAADGWGYGAVTWLGLATFAAIPVVLILTYRPKVIERISVFSGLGRLAGNS